MDVTDDDLQRAIEESMRTENRRRESSFSSPGLNESVDDELMAQALKESLAMESHRMGMAKTSNEEDEQLKMAIEQSMHQSENNDKLESSTTTTTTTTDATSNAFSNKDGNVSYASAVGKNQSQYNSRTNVRKREQLLDSPDDEEDALLMAAIQASMTQDQTEMARQSKAENRKAKKKLKKLEKRRSGGGNNNYNNNFNLRNPNPTNFEKRRSNSNSNRYNKKIVDLTSNDSNKNYGKNTKKSTPSFDNETKSLKLVAIKDMKDELRHLGVPFSDCFTRKDIESRLLLAREALDTGNDLHTRNNKRRGNSFSSLSTDKSSGNSAKRDRKPKVDPKFLEEAQQAAELVEREDLLSVLPDEIRMKAEILYAEAMAEYRRIFSRRNGSRLVRKPHIRDCITKAKYQVQNEQRARMDEAKRKQKAEEKRIQEIVEQAEREEQLSALPDNIRIEAEMTFANMMSEFQQVGGRMPRLDYAISIATDKVKEEQRKRDEEMRKIKEEQMEEERKIKEAEEAKIKAQKDAEEKIIQERNNESRSARAARFAAAYEKRMAANSSSKNDENNQQQAAKRK
jgi:hypothetical protein